jgi:N-acetyl-anhydromuramyl-L-alanine amidase AmpD
MRSALFCLILAVGLSGCAVKPGTRVERHGDEIMVAGQLFRIGTPVVLWTDPGGYDAYRVKRRFVPLEEAGWEASQDALDSPNRYNLRKEGLSEAEIERVRGGGWDLDLLQREVDLFVIHYDACGVSRRCFEVLHDQRTLSAHFLLDIDGTIYQTLDVKERAWHAGPFNSRSVGIEIANIGAYPAGGDNPLDRWYGRDGRGRTILTPPGDLASTVRTPNFVGRPSRNGLIVADIQGRPVEQHDYTDEQYETLIKLTAALHRVLPRIELRAPRDENGQVIPRVLPHDTLASYHGLIGHYHLTDAKTDPGPAFDWDRVIDGAKDELRW